MDTIPKEYENKTKSLLRELGLPKDVPQNHCFFRPVQLATKSPKHYKLSLLIEKYVKETEGNRGPAQLEQLKKHWCWMLLGLSRAMFMNNWLVVSLKTNDYSQDHWLKRYGLKYAYVKSIVDYLKEKELIELLPGKRYKNNPSRTRIYPKETLTGHLIEYAFAVEEAIEGPYLTLRDKNSIWREVVHNLDDDHPDLRDMNAINEFLKGHQWACKGPVKLIYTSSPFEGGRLYTPFQNLPDRRARIRINTLINEKPICEVDFNANHLRMNLAINAKKYAGDTPYEDICEIAGDIPRDMVKQFITVAMGAEEETSARNALRLKGFSDIFFDKIHTAVIKRYPKLKLFNGWGVNLQSLEGQILKDVMVSGLKEGIVCLPVHDAIAVQQEHKDWAVEAMKYTWAVHLDGCPTRVSVDEP